MTANVQDAIVLLGDSITEYGFEPNGLGFAARLAGKYRSMHIRLVAFTLINAHLWLLQISMLVNSAWLIVVSRDIIQNGRFLSLSR